ncbi:unnamed protein product [Gadus morhua 'NCC']
MKDGDPADARNAGVSSVGELKALVAQQQGLPAAGPLRLLFAGRELQDVDTLQEKGAGQRLTRLDLHTDRCGLAVALETSPASPSPAEDGEEGGGAECQTNGYRTFYVFCKSVCGAVRPGKLRVRCGACRQSTLTLSRVIPQYYHHQYPLKYYQYINITSNTTTIYCISPQILPIHQYHLKYYHHQYHLSNTNTSI